MQYIRQFFGFILYDSRAIRFGTVCIMRLNVQMGLYVSKIKFSKGRGQCVIVGTACSLPWPVGNTSCA